MKTCAKHGNLGCNWKIQKAYTVPARIVPAATIKGFEFFGAGSIRVATLQVLLTKKN